MKIRTEKDILFEMIETEKLIQYGIVIVDGKITTVDQHLKQIK